MRSIRFVPTLAAAAVLAAAATARSAAAQASGTLQAAVTVLAATEPVELRLIRSESDELGDPVVFAKAEELAEVEVEVAKPEEPNVERRVRVTVAYLR